MKKPAKIDEKTVRVLACAVAVAVMILLLSGDMFLSRLIHVNPNQEYKENDRDNKQSDVKQEESKQTVQSNIDNTANPNVDYDVTFMNQISLKETYDKIMNQETVLVLSGRSTCGPCKRFVPVLKSVYSELHIKDGIYLDRNSIKSNTEGYQEFLDLSDTISENFGGTPFFMIFQDGKLKDYILGITSEEEVKEDLIRKIQNVIK